MFFIILTIKTKLVIFFKRQNFEGRKEDGGKKIVESVMPMGRLSPVRGWMLEKGGMEF